MQLIRSIFFIYLLSAYPIFAQNVDTALWRLDCGDLGEVEGGVFSTDHSYDGAMISLTNSCYLIRHRGQHILWDAGLPLAALQLGTATLESQLAELGLTTEDVSTVILSHHHMDHTGQLDVFSQAELVIGFADWRQVGAASDGTVNIPFVNTASFQPWLDSPQTVQTVSGELDLFGDGVIKIISAPGHTAGSVMLLLKLPNTGFVILSGDVAHFERQYQDRNVAKGSFDFSMARETMARVSQLEESLPARFIIGHDPTHRDLLPIFPEPAR